MFDLASIHELTRNLYGLLLLVEAGLFFAGDPLFERWRGGRSLPAGIARLGRGLWTAAAVAGLAIVILTGHYGGQMVYSYGVGTQQPAAQTTSNARPGPYSTL